MKKQWNNWAIFFISVVVSLLFALVVAKYYLNSSLFSGGFLAMEAFDLAEAYVSSFLLLYTFFLTFFYRTFSKNFKPITLVYFLALPLLLFISSLAHLAIFLGLLAAGFVSGIAARKFL